MSALSVHFCSSHQRSTESWQWCCQDTKGASAWQPLESATEKRRCFCGCRCWDCRVGWWLWAKDDLKNLYFSLFKPADNCWSVCALLQLAPSSVCSTVVMLLAVPELINLDRGAKSPWGSRSRCSSGVLSYLLQSLPWCTQQVFDKIYIETHFIHSS